MTTRWSLLALSLLAAGCASQPEPLRTAAGVSADLSRTDWSQAQTVDVKLSDFTFEPDHLRFDRGRPYRLHLENTGSGGHNFDAAGFFASVALRDDATSSRLRADGGKIEVPSRSAVDLYFEPQLAGTYPLECSHPLHATFGMTGEIVVP